MIENSMVIGDYYPQVAEDEYVECEECNREAEFRMADGTWLCNHHFEEESRDCPCIFCLKHCDETCEVEDDA